MMGHGETDKELASKLTDQLEEALSYYEAHLSDGGYIIGKVSLCVRAGHGDRLTNTRTCLS